MRGAELWKRILNEGLAGFQRPPSHPVMAECVGRIIKAPVITDSRPVEVDFERRDDICFPFNEFWLEGYSHEHTGTTILYGALVRRAENGVGMCLCVLASTTQFPIVSGTFRFTHDEKGRVVDHVSLACPESVAAHGERFMNNLIGNTGFMVLDTLNFLTCKNIGIEPRSVAGVQSRRAAKRFGGDPSYYKYHVLTVRPAGSKPGTPGREIGATPRHICRGHYHHYGPEYGKGLLFGKYAGKFWIDPHDRGDKKNGVVEKDYLVKAS